MKKSVLILFILISTNAFTQELKLDDNNKYSAQGVEQFNLMKKDLLFEKGQEWINLNYKSVKDIIQLTDKAQGKIIVRGSFSIVVGIYTYIIIHTLTIDFKDEKMRYTYSNFTVDNLNLQGYDSALENNRWYNKKFIRKTNEKIQKNASDLISYINRNLSKKDDW